MKKSNKLLAAGSGLMVAAAFGLSQAMATDGTMPEPVVGGNQIELSDLSTVQETMPGTASEPKDQEGQEVKNEDASATEQPSTNEPGDKVADNQSGSSVQETKNPSGQGDKNSQQTSSEDTSDTAAANKSAVPEVTDTQNGEATVEEAPSTATQGAAQAKETRPAESSDEELTHIFQNQDDAVSDGGQKPVEVNYSFAPSYHFSAPTKTNGAEVKVETAPLGPVIELQAQKTENTAPGDPAKGSDDNGQSMVVWFELPPAEGPSLQAGQATQPLLGTAVSESPVNANVIETQQSTQPLLSAQQAPSQVQSLRNTQAAKQVEQGALSRGLARTGSVAQYAAMMSAAALIVGVGMLIGAAATRRKHKQSPEQP